MSEDVIYRIEKGLTPTPRYETLEMLAPALGTSIESLIAAISHGATQRVREVGFVEQQAGDRSEVFRALAEEDVQQVAGLVRDYAVRSGRDLKDVVADIMQRIEDGRAAPATPAQDTRNLLSTSTLDQIAKDLKGRRKK